MGRGGFMILPIVAYGHPVLRKVAQDIDADYPFLEKLTQDMWETMYASNGVGLAAPQVNKDVRLFIVDSHQIFENMKPDERNEYPDDPGIKQVFLNAHIQEIDGEEWAYNEGCLSIPKIREDIVRNFKWHTNTFQGITARIILHEHDHLEGKLFIDYLPPLKRKLMKRKLDDISKGKITVDYKMVFPK